MTKLLIKIFVRENVGSDSAVRTRFGLLSGSVGIFINALLCVIKLIAGSLTNSIAITADAVNNLSDAGTSVVTLFSFKLAGKPADDEHPFGHGRLEYICALIVSFIILFMGIELVSSSIDKIRNPEEVVFGWVPLAILAFSVFGKLWLAFFNKTIGKKINSAAVGAVVADSLSDTAATSVTILSLVLANFTKIPIDGYLGIVVALFIFAAGIGILRDTSSSLLGRTPTKELVKDIEGTILSYDGVTGVHDMMLHNYGEGHFFGSVHAEVPSSIDIMKSHDTIDTVERDLHRIYGVNMVIHLDPVVVDDAHINELREMTEKMLAEIDPKLSFHDFRVVEGPTHTNLIFDVVVPHKYDLKHSELSLLIAEKLHGHSENYYAVTTVEESYV